MHLNKGKLKMYLDFFFYRCVGLVGSSQRQKVFLSMRGCHDQFPYRVQILRVVFDRKKRASQLELCLKRFRTYLCFFLILHSFHLSICGAEMMLAEVRIVRGVLLCTFF